MISFNEKLECAIRKNNSILCVGLDPDITKFPKAVKLYPANEQTLLFIKKVIDLTKCSVCAYKIQKAFFDILPDGHDVLEKVIKYVHETTSVPVILDCKIGDIDNTMKIYMKNIFEILKADAVLVNPYMGDEVFCFTEKYKDRGFIVLCQTSNNGAKIVQEQMVDGEFLWKKILRLSMNRWNKNKNIIPVISSNTRFDKSILQIILAETPVLLAGYGAQGGKNVSEYDELLRDRKVFVNSSRGILFNFEEEKWEECIGENAVNAKEKLNELRK